MLDWDTDNTAAIRAVLDGFRGVWERVEGSAAASAAIAPGHARGADVPSFDACLRDKAAAETEAAMYDRALAVRSRGAGRSALLEHAAQAACRAAFLRGAVFLRTGELRRPPELCPRVGDALTALREGMLRDEASASAYRRMAGGTDDRELAAALERFAAEATAAAAEKRRIILRCFRVNCQTKCNS